MRVLITGGAGFIGSHTAQAALRAGHSVRVLDNLSTGSPDNLPAEVEFVPGDVTDPVAVEQAMQGCAGVIHLAALVSVPQSVEAPLLAFQSNAAGTANLLEAARRHGVGRFVLASTCAVYGLLPGHKDESSPTDPLSPYAASKLMAEEWGKVYTAAYGLPTVILRYFNVYGPRQRADSAYSGVIARWLAAAGSGQPCIVFGDGEQTRDFVSVHDVAAANLLALTDPAIPPATTLTVATGVSHSLNELLTLIEQTFDRPIERQYREPRLGDLLHSSGSSHQLQAYGWRPQVSLAEGIRELARGASHAFLSTL